MDIATQLPAALDVADERLNRKAYAAIVMVIEDSQLMNVQGMTLASECWDTLQRLHRRDFMVSRISLT